MSEILIEQNKFLKLRISALEKELKLSQRSNTLNNYNRKHLTESSLKKYPLCNLPIKSYKSST